MSNQLPNLWTSSPDRLGLSELVYVSQLLGSDPRITNFGGGNTSLKVTEKDPMTGQDVQVLWVKGSGGDLGSAGPDGYASLYLDKLYAMEGMFRGGKHEDEFPALYQHAIFNLNPRAPSIDTPLHAFVPYPAVAHMHSDSVIAIAASEDGEKLTKEIWGDDMFYLPWKRPGFELGMMLKEGITANPKAKGALMGSHGFINWADTWEECYADTIDMINKAQAYIDAQKSDKHPFGDLVRTVKEDNAEAKLAEILPTLRGLTAHNGLRLIACVDQSDEALDFMARARCEELAGLGTSCPDHFLRTKIWPMVVTGDLNEALDAYRAKYTAYYERCKKSNSPAMRNPNPTVILFPGLGMVSLGKNPQEARVTGEFYRNAIRVMNGAEVVSKYQGLPEQEAFDIEYWLLEEAKLQRMPAEKDLSRQVAFITGGAQGIGLATAKRLLSEGACVIVADINEEKLAEAKAALPKDSALTVNCDVSCPDQIKAALQAAVLKFGGIDIVMANAGVSRRGGVAEAEPADNKLQSDILVSGYFDTISTAVKIMLQQKLGGNVVVISSKNGVATGAGAAFYSAAKAFELHLMRTVAADYASAGIRSNAVNPDGVIQGSGIWQGEWRDQTAAKLGIKPEELVEHYRQRNMLKVVVTPEDIAEAVAWLVNDKKSSRTTGCVITVDGGNKEGFLR